MKSAAKEILLLVAILAPAVVAPYYAGAFGWLYVRYEDVQTPSGGEIVIAAVTATLVAFLWGLFRDYQVARARKRELDRIGSALAVNEGRLRSLLDNLPASVALMDIDERYALTNKEFERRDRPASDAAIGKTGDQLWSGNLLKLAASGHGAVREQRVAATGEVQITTADGRTRDLLRTVFPVVSGSVLHGTGMISVDITDQKATERALRAIQAMTDALLAASPDFILLISPDGLIKQVSESVAKAFGTTVDELKGRSPLEFMPDDLAEARRRHLRSVVETRSPLRYEDEKDGRWFDNILQPILDERGNVEHVAIFSRDVTDLKRAQRAAQESEARFKAILDNAPMVVHLKDPDGRFVHVNKAFLSEWGCEQESIVGRLCEDIFPEEMAQEYVALDAEVLRERMVREREIEAVTADGRRTSRRVVKFPVKDTEGGFLGIGTIDVNITQRKRAEEALRESEARLKAIIDNAPMVVHLKDPDGRFIHVNKVFLDDFGLAEAEIIGKTSAHIFPEYLTSDYESLESTVLRERRIHERELETVIADGRRKLRHVVKFPVTDSEGRLLGTGTIGTDITAQRQAEEARRESEDLLRSLIDHSPASIHLKDLSGRYLMANWAFEESLGVAPGGTAGKGAEDFFAKREIAQIRRVDRTVVRSKRSARDFVELGRLGKSVYRDVVKFPILGDDGQAVAIATIDTDVTEKKRAEDALRESEARFRAVVEHAPAAISLKDRQGRYILTNARFDEWHGLSPGQAIGTDNYDWFPKGRADLRAAEDRDILATARNLEHEMEIAFPAGGMRSILRAKFPVRSAAGKISAIGCVSIDVTERKRARAELEKQKNLLEAVFRDVPDAMVFADESGTIVRANPAVTQCFSFGEDEVLGKSLSVLFERKSDYGACARPKRRGSASASMTPQVFAFKRRSGETFSGEIASTLVRGEGVDHLGSVHVIRDVSDRLAAERRARELQAELAHVARLNTMGEMASGLAHELNQPLTAVANYAQGSLRAAREGAIGPDELVRVLGLISDQALRAGGIIRRLRQFVRKGEPQRNRIDINDIVRETVDFLRPEALESDVRLTRRLAAALPPVVVDTIGIQQVLVNLIRNAVEAVSADPGADRRVVIRTSVADDGCVAVSVENDGAAISRDVTEHMFDPFYTTKSKGMGLGLSIARTIVESHGGRMVVRSAPETGNAIGFGNPPDSRGHRDGERDKAAAE